MRNKKRVVILLLIGIPLFSLTTACEGELNDSNKQETLLSSDKTWIENVWWTCCPSLEITESFSIGGDTTINDKCYKTILCTRTSTAESDMNTDIQNQVVGMARETVEGKVYQRVFGKDYLFYDFTLSVGDTIGNEVTRGSWRVAEVDNIEVLGQLRKRLLLKSRCSSAEMIWLEGIGSSQGLFYQGACYNTTQGESELELQVDIQGGSFTSLNSVTQNGKTIYKND